VNNSIVENVELYSDKYTEDELFAIQSTNRIINEIIEANGCDDWEWD
jgi:hypothetical protein